MRVYPALALLATIALTLSSCGSRIDRVKTGSPLASVVGGHSVDRDQRVRRAVLRQLPIGSSREQMELFIRENFRGVRYRVTIVDDARAFVQLRTPHVLIRALDMTSFPGIDRVEIYLILTPDERLKDVLVRSEERYV